MIKNLYAFTIAYFAESSVNAGAVVYIYKLIPR